MRIGPANVRWMKRRRCRATETERVRCGNSCYYSAFSEFCSKTHSTRFFDRLFFTLRVLFSPLSLWNCVSFVVCHRFNKMFVGRILCAIFRPPFCSASPEWTIFLLSAFIGSSSGRTTITKPNVAISLPLAGNKACDRLYPLGYLSVMFSFSINQNTGG